MYNIPSIETASKGNAILMWDALEKSANGLKTTIDETRVSIETLDGLISDYGDMIDYAEDSSNAIQILRRRHILGLEIYPPNVEPLESIWVHRIHWNRLWMMTSYGTCDESEKDRRPVETDQI